jgi:hypothetical protein
MIQPLRSVHRCVFSGLAVLLPAIFLAGLAARYSRPRTSMEAPQLPSSARLVLKSDELWKKHPIRSQFYRDANDPHGVHVVLRPLREVNEPDLLLYWSAAEARGGALPAEAQLLGSLVAGKAWPLPQEAGPTSHLILYSLAHQVTVDSATVEKLP